MEDDLDGLSGSCQLDSVGDLVQRQDVGDELLRREDRRDGQIEGCLD